jgi:hypothetical protein
MRIFLLSRRHHALTSARLAASTFLEGDERDEVGAFDERQPASVERGAAPSLSEIGAWYMTHPPSRGKIRVDGSPQGVST